MNDKHRKYGFTMIELLTVVAIIAMLVGLLIPALNMVRNAAKQAKQRAQLTTIDSALMVWRNDQGDYPPSDLNQDRKYCGAQKLAEALLGWDLLGFHPNSAWRADGLDQNGGDLTYDPFKRRNLGFDSLRERKQPYLELGTTSAFRLGTDGTTPGLFSNPLPLEPKTYVICDIFGIRRISLGKGNTVTAGSPILYYRANTSSKTMDLSLDPSMVNQIYNAYDNLFLLALGKLTPDGKPSNDPVGHPLYGGGTGEYLYDPEYKIIDPKVLSASGRLWPHRPDSYILISAGLDGEYGTRDDIFNF